MGKWLAATCKGLSVAAGPLGAIGEFALKLYDDDRSERRDAELRELLVGGKAASREALEEIFELKNDLSSVREQLISGISGIKELLQVGPQSVSTPEELEAVLTEKLIDENRGTLERIGFITEEKLKEELVTLYGHGTSFDRLWMLVEEAGFDTCSLPSSGARDVIIFQFLRELPRRTTVDRERILRRLASDSPGSTILKTIQLLLKERMQILLREGKDSGESGDSRDMEARGPKREKKAKREQPPAGILFLDIKRYSDLKLDELTIYHEYVTKALYSIAVRTEVGNVDDYLYKNSWGDGIVLVHTDYWRLVSVGLELRSYFKNKKYERIVDDNGNERIELRGRSLLPRIAIHFGEFRKCEDSFKGGNICYGPSLFLPARIEPVTPAGRVWVTYRIKDFVEDRQGQREGGRQIKFIEHGYRRLAKNFGVEQIYEAYWEDEPEPLRLDDEIDPEALDQVPEDYEEVDEEDVKRIEALTSLSPKDKKISVCSRDPLNNKCPAKAKSMRVISEVARNGYAATEECEVSFWIKAILESTKPVVERIRHSRKGIEFYPLLQQLNLDIGMFLKCLNNFSRACKSWPDMDDWPYSFFAHRVEAEKAINEGKSFVLWVEKVKSCYERIRAGKTIKEIVPGDIDAETSDCLFQIHNYGERLAIHLKDLGKERAFTTKQVLSEELCGFNRFRFAWHLKKVTERLALELGKKPSVWA